MDGRPGGTRRTSRGGSRRRGGGQERSEWGGPRGGKGEPPRGARVTAAPAVGVHVAGQVALGSGGGGDEPVEGGCLAGVGGSGNHERDGGTSLAKACTSQRSC